MTDHAPDRAHLLDQARARLAALGTAQLDDPATTAAFFDQAARIKAGLTQEELDILADEARAAVHRTIADTLAWATSPDGPPDGVWVHTFVPGEERVFDSSYPRPTRDTASLGDYDTE